MQNNRPFVFINGAMSADGKISSRSREQVRISGPLDRERVDALRAGSDGIMVGVGTVLADDPHLRIRSPALRSERKNRGLPEHPLRIVADSMARTPLGASILGEGCIIAVSASASAERIAKLSKSAGIVRSGESRVDLSILMGLLYDRGVSRLMVEGGAELNWSLIEAQLVDEISVFVGPVIIGGRGAPTLVDGPGFIRDFPRLKLRSIEAIDGGALLSWQVL